MRCQVCSNESLSRFLDLGSSPVCIFPTEASLESEQSYPLNAHYCPSCGLVQLGYLVDQEVMFTDDYHHIAALSSSFKSHLGSLAEDSTRRFGLTSDDLVLEIGSNDGALLEAFSVHGVRILGVDPSDVSKIAIENGVPTIEEFFDEELGAKIAREHGKAKLIAALNTFAHVSAMSSFMRGIRHVLTPACLSANLITSSI